MAKRNQEEAQELKASKAMDIAAGQKWQEAEHENPFDKPMVALVDEVRENSHGVKYVRFSFAPKGQEPGKVFEAVSETEFRARFSKLQA